MAPVSCRSHFGTSSRKYYTADPIGLRLPNCYFYQRGVIAMARLIDEPEGWQHLQDMAKQEKDPQQLASIIDKMNRLLDQHEWKAPTEAHPHPRHCRMSDRAARLEVNS